MAKQMCLSEPETGRLAASPAPVRDGGKPRRDIRALISLKMTRWGAGGLNINSHPYEHKKNESFL